MLDRQRPLSVQVPADATHAGPVAPVGVRGGSPLGTPPSPPTGYRIAAQDAHTLSVRDTQRQIQLDFAITESQLEEIIEEGVEKEWLDEYATPV